MLRGLWYPAICTNAVLCSITVGVRLGIYPTIRDGMTSATGSKGPSVVFSSGLISGACGYFCGSLLYMMKNKLQAEGGLKGPDGVYITGARKGFTPSCRNGAVGLYHTVFSEGAAGLWRVSGVLVARGATLSSSQLMGYDGTKSFCKEKGLLQDGPLLQAVASVVGAVTLTTCVMPLDVTLTRYQTAKNVIGKDFAGPLECASSMYKQEGVGVFFRGWTPMFVRMLPSSLITFFLYENIRNLAGFGFMD